MKANSYFFGKKPYLFEIPKEEFLDINEMRDYLLARAIVEYGVANDITESKKSQNDDKSALGGGGKKEIDYLAA